MLFRSPLFSHLASTPPEDTYAPIDIPSYDVEITGPWSEVPVETSLDVSPELPSETTLVSTSVDPLSAYSSVIPCDDTHANLSSDDEE